MIASRLLLASFALLVWLPQVAEACAVCGAGQDDRTRAAFLTATVMLSILPFLLVGGVVWWLLRRSREIERERIAATPATPLSVSRASSSP